MVFPKEAVPVMLEDLREQMKPEFREWADDVGWPYNYALQVAVHDKRDSLDYIKWVSLITVLMEAYEQTVLWFDYGTDAPVTRAQACRLCRIQDRDEGRRARSFQPSACG